MLAIKLAFKNPFIAIAAGVALVALGTALGSIANNAVSGGGGGRGIGSGSRDFTGSTAGSGSFSSSGGTASNTNFSSGGGTVVFEIAGTKLIGVLSNTLSRNKALGGANLIAT